MLMSESNYNSPLHHNTRHHTMMKPTARSKRWSLLIMAMAYVGVIAVVATGHESQDSNRWANPNTTLEMQGYRAGGYPAFSRADKELVMGFTVRGIVAEVLVEETEVVEPGTPLIRLKDDLQYWTTEAHRIAAEDMTGIDDAVRGFELAEYDLKSMEAAAARDAASPREVVHTRSGFARAETAVRAAELSHQQAVAQYNREKARLEEMTIKSPIDGVVVRIQVDPGEVVEDLTPVVQIASLDPLRMEVAVPIQLGLKLKANMDAVVRWRDLNPNQPVDAKIKFVVPVADAASNQMIVRVEIDNPEKIPAGLHGYVSFPEAEEIWRREVERQQ